MSLAHIFPLTENVGLLVTNLVLGFLPEISVFFVAKPKNWGGGADAFLVLESS